MYGIWCWFCYHAVTKWPGNIYDAGWQRSIWMWLLPYAGDHAYTTR